ncbi:ACP S-malonyltransferase [Arhodomonas sp. AD133]|uniref:ACP S-malonyltransferase n=1 Tax=Arhodomonas sp. AD133 TaxID=3415009 RepID=UPI003EBA4310
MHTDTNLGFVFPGQGSQSIGMLAELAAGERLVRETFEQASDAVGTDLWRLSQEGPEDSLNRTDLTQPALLAAGVAVWRVWCAHGGSAPAILAGHSLGEYTALVCADAFGLEDAARVVHDRGRFMQEAVPAGEGAMAAILGLEDEQVREICEAARGNEVVSAVNYNAPGQVVVAGSRAAVERAVERAKEAGAKRAVTLPVSVPSHCSLMEPAAERLKERLATVALSAPRIPVLHNVDVTAAESAESIRDRLVRQLFNPVRWVETIHAMRERGVTRLVEAGPGKVLTGLNRRIERRMPIKPVMDPKTLEAALEEEGAS